MFLYLYLLPEEKGDDLSSEIHLFFTNSTKNHAYKQKEISGTCIDKTIEHSNSVNRIINLKGDIKMTEIDQATLAKAAEDYKQWMFTDGESETTLLLPADEFVEDMVNRYGLKNTKIDQFVRWEDRMFGLNGGYTSEEVKRWIVDRCDGSTEPIRYGDTIAIGLGTQPTWLNFANRNVGVNLEYQSIRSCQWRILGGPIGTFVKTKDHVALLNEKSMASKSEKGEPLIYFDRLPGHFDVGYPTSQGVWANLKDHLEDIVDFYESAKESDKQSET
jgi:hypothetical protein